MNKQVIKCSKFLVITFVTLVLLIIALGSGMLPLSFLLVGFVIWSLKDKLKGNALYATIIVFCLILYSLKLLVWMYGVSHGHFFEFPNCWLSETSYLRAYLPMMLRGIVVDFCLLMIVFIIGHLFFKRRNKK